MLVDANGGFAMPAFSAARDAFAEKVRSQGIAALAVRRGRHFSALWWEVEWLAAQKGLVALAFVNSAAFVSHSPGRADRVYGTNPLAFACPRRGSAPLVFDQASAAMARGEVQLHLREGKALPLGVAVDSNGRPTTDPAAALQGDPIQHF